MNVSGKSESVYRRRNDNAMAKIKSTKGQTTIYKRYTQIRVSDFPFGIFKLSEKDTWNANMVWCIHATIDPVVVI
jgi:hypothetical protein